MFKKISNFFTGKKEEEEKIECALIVPWDPLQYDFIGFETCRRKFGFDLRSRNDDTFLYFTIVTKLEYEEIEKIKGIIIELLIKKVEKDNK